MPTNSKTFRTIEELQNFQERNELKLSLIIVTWKDWQFKIPRDVCRKCGKPCNSVRKLCRDCYLKGPKHRVSAMRKRWNDILPYPKG